MGMGCVMHSKVPSVPCVHNSSVRSAKQYLTYVSSGPFQYAIAEALALPDSYFTAFRDNIRPLGESDGFAFCRALPERAGVVAIPNAVFYDHRQAGAPFVRFAFCKRTGVLEDAVQRLKTLAG
jgi:N-succinyldiaminopimelate aminotransferase